jgi:hypothetical protein
MANDYDVSSLIDDSSPLRASGIDPKDAIKDPDAVMKYLQNRQYGAGVAQPSTLKANMLQPDQIPMASAASAPSQPTDWGSIARGTASPGTAGANVSNGQPASDPDLDNTRRLALKAEQRTDANQDQWNALTDQRKAIEAQRQKDAGYIDPHGTSPTTGASYKPSTGRQVLRGVLGGVEGLMRGGFRGAVLGGIDPRNEGVPGYGDPTAQYGRDVARQGATVASDDQQLKNITADAKDQYDAGRNLGTDTTANAKVFGDIFTAKKNAETEANAAKTADTRQQHEDDVEQYNRNRAEIADRNATTNARKTDALITAALARANKDDRTTPGSNTGLKGVPLAKVTSYAAAHNLDPDSLTPEQLGEALRIGAGPAHVKDPQAFESKWNSDFQKMQQPFQQERNQIVRRGAVPDVTKNKAAWNDLDKEDQDQITASLNDLENRRTAKNAELQQAKDAEATQYGVYGKAAQSAAAAPSAPRAAATQPRQQPAAASKPPAGATMKVPGSDGKLYWSDGKSNLGLAQ